MTHAAVPDNAPKDPALSNKLYDFLRFIAQILLPAAGTAYAAIAALWGWGAVTQVVGTIVAIDTLLGVVVSYLKAKYDGSDAAFDGVIQAVHEDGVKTYNMVLNSDPATLDQQDKVTFKVNPTVPPANNGF
jgi:hypothetical protein